MIFCSNEIKITYSITILLKINNVQLTGKLMKFSLISDIRDYIFLLFSQENKRMERQTGATRVVTQEGLKYWDRQAQLAW